MEADQHGTTGEATGSVWPIWDLVSASLEKGKDDSEID